MATSENNLIKSVEAIERLKTREECTSDGGSAGVSDTNDSQ